MGLFGKKDKAGDGKVHVKGMMADPAAFGGPSSASVDENDPIWDAIDGVGLDQYATITKGAADQGITDEAGLLAYAESQGVGQAAFQSAMSGWNDRMKQSMAVGQRFNAVYMGKS
ncbi:MAG: hypothetical protein HKN41_01375 [Ilumatobacter sp.]|nr:hypothetical protein [Ilumatobacter sp.]